MTSIRTNLPAQYRARAQEARDQAAAASDEEKRQRLVRDAQLWERMAEYEEKNNPSR